MRPGVTTYAILALSSLFGLLGAPPRALPGRRVWVAWSPTGEGRKSRVRLRLPSGRIERAERMPLAAGPPEVVPWSDAGGGEVDVEVGEAPVYLWIRSQSRHS